MINGSTLISRRYETCGVVKNITTIQVCENSQWKEICDGNFTQEDAQVICRDLGLSAIRKLAHDLGHALLRSTRLQFLLLYNACMHCRCNCCMVTSVRVLDHLPLVTIPSATAKNRAYPSVITYLFQNEIAPKYT